MGFDHAFDVNTNQSAATTSQNADNGVDVLLLIPDVELVRVDDGVHSTVDRDLLVVAAIALDTGIVYQAQVGKTAWAWHANLPTLRLNRDTFIFTLTDQANTCFAINLSPSTAEDKRMQLEMLVRKHTLYQPSVQAAERAAAPETTVRVEPSASPVPAADEDASKSLYQSVGAAPMQPRDRWAAAIHRNSLWAAANIAHGAVAASNILSSYGKKVRKQSQPRVQPVHVSEFTKRSAHTARFFTRNGASAINAVVAGVGTVTVYVAESVVAAASAVTPRSVKQSEAVKSGQSVTGASVAGVLQLWEAVEEGVKLVFSTATSETAQYIEHKYGKEAGEIAWTTGGVAKDVYKASRALRQLRLKVIATLVAKHTAAGMFRSARSAELQPSDLQGANTNIPAMNRASSTGKAVVV